ncbi:histidine kinase [Mitsuaria sp. GD03876]|uniref:sensor histidine kinase n=1 Tax=Mitsuaria sp. GD03876 TaxID=2975399 RepID=UPI00244C74B3|nr:histidine kinase [Mitsuaria sp. GD03876]MDH0865560.1 histidine kinase [Mitsuaria sp. GD03876]
MTTPSAPADAPDAARGAVSGVVSGAASRAASGAARSDWTYLIFPGPQRSFTDAELSRSGLAAWPTGIDYYVTSNVLVLGLVFYTMLPRHLAHVILIGGLAMATVGLGVARWLWRQPTRTRFNGATLGLSVLMLLVTLVMVKLGFREEARDLLPFGAGGMTLTVSSWWFLTLYRTQQLGARLAELDAQDERIAMAQRLATAQIQPHFLFNTLASLQHWVDTRDDRAGPTLRSLTRYLRATLPMFEQDRLPLEQELQIVRSYLDIMQARLGQRLTWSLELDESAQATMAGASLPPGTLLTLAENAITHGIEPSLRGGHIAVRARAIGGGRLRLEVQDGGQGLAPGACDGLGLANTRERLMAQFGGRAALGLEPAPADAPGCLAWVEVPASAPSA